MSGTNEIERVEAQMKQLGISAEHHGSVQGINRYLQTHRVNQLFNVRLDNLPNLNLFVLALPGTYDQHSEREAS